MMQKNKRINTIETAMRQQIDAVIKAKPESTFADVMDALQASVKKDVETKPGDAPILFMALMNVVQHYRKTLPAGATENES